MELSINDEQLASIVDNIITGISVFAISEDRELIPVYINNGLNRMLGYSHEDLEKMIKNIRRIIIPDDMPVFEQGIDDILKDDGAVEYEFRTVTGEGNIRWLQIRANLYGKLDGYPLISGVIIDATERKSIDEELALQAERLNILSESTKEHLVDYNSRTDVLNIRLENSAYNHGEVVVKDFLGKFDFASVYFEDRDNLKEEINAARKHPLSNYIDFRCNFFEDGSDFQWYRATITSVRGADGYVSRIVGRIVNIDAQKQREIELQMKADRDALTGLFNKSVATELITEAIVRASTKNKISALMMFDLDHFKQVNDTFGHFVGDMVIEESGKILNDTFKGRDVVGRVGGDEFMVFMYDIKGEEDAMSIAEQLNSALSRTIEDSQGSVTVTASIGITLCDGSITDFDKLYEQADRALYITKQNGRNGRTLFNSEMAD